MEERAKLIDPFKKLLCHEPHNVLLIYSVRDNYNICLTFLVFNSSYLVVNRDQIMQINLCW